jgi:hypothetical protein
MKPLGRQYTKHNCKWKVKEKGKSIKGWWEDTINPNKTLDRELAKEDISSGVDQYEADCFDKMEDDFDKQYALEN